MPNDRTRDNEQIKDHIRQEMRRTRLSPEQLSQLLSEHAGIALRPEQIRTAIRKNSKAIAAPEWGKVLEFLRTLPNRPRSVGSGINRYISITDEMAQELHQEFERTGVRVQMVLIGKPQEVEGLTAVKISTWRTGRIRQAVPKEWEYVISKLRSFPDAQR